MWICVGPRDPDTKPSRGCLRVVELSAIPQLPTLIVPGEEAITKKGRTVVCIYFFSFAFMCELCTILHLLAKISHDRIYQPCDKRHSGSDWFDWIIH